MAARPLSPTPASLAIARWLRISGAVAGALLLAPLALLPLVPLMVVGGLVRAVALGLTDLEVLPRRRTLEVDGEGIALAWSGAEGASEAALADGIDLVLETARRTGEVGSLRSVELDAGEGQPAGSLRAAAGRFGEVLAGRLDGRRVAYGVLVVNEGELALAIEIDARSDRTGRIAVELPADRWLVWTRALLDLAPAWGFKVRSAGLQLPPPDPDEVVLRTS